MALIKGVLNRGHSGDYVEAVIITKCSHLFSGRSELPESHGTSIAGTTLNTIQLLVIICT